MPDIDSRLVEIIDCLYRVSAKAVIINDSKILLTHEPEGWYSLPGGGIDFGETITGGLERELHEEIEFHNCALEIAPTVLFVTNQEMIDQIPRMQLYFSVKLSDPRVLAAKELEYTWASKHDFDKLTLSPSAREARPQLEKLLTKT